MIYLTGSNGLVGSRLSMCFGDLKFTKISYRDTVPDVFKSHDSSCLIHLGWSSNTRLKEKTKDVDNSKKLFELYQKKNPNGKIIFLSSAGDLHRDNNGEYPKPHSLYGKSKLQVKAISRKTAEKNETFLVGAQNISIYDIINIVSMRGTLNLKINQKAEKSYLNINTTKVKETFDWEPKLFLK